MHGLILMAMELTARLSPALILLVSPSMKSFQKPMSSSKLKLQRRVLVRIGFTQAKNNLIYLKNAVCKAETGLFTTLVDNLFGIGP